MTNHNKVIILPRPKVGRWRYFVVRLASGRLPLDDWARKQIPEEARFALLDALKDAQKIENPTDWLCFKRHMKGKLKKYKVWELWFDCRDNREYRLLGVTGPERKQAIFLIGCYHKGNTYTPTDALETALKRAQDLAGGKLEIYERQIPIDR